MSAESGLKTFRDSNGLWEGHDVMEVASPQGFANNPFHNPSQGQKADIRINGGGSRRIGGRRIPFWGGGSNA